MNTPQFKKWEGSRGHNAKLVEVWFATVFCMDECRLILMKIPLCSN